MPSTDFKFFELKTAADMFRKLQADLVALEASYQDTWLAFNFFVTAEHLPDWLGKRDLVQKFAILRIASHVANGAKHFKLNDSRHQSITGTEKSRYLEDEYYQSGYFYEPLLIHLSQKEADELNAPTTIDAVTLGHKVIEFWTPYISK
jgi:hypothetical protein